MRYLLVIFLMLVVPKTHACELLNNLALKRMDAGYTFIKSYRIDIKFRLVNGKWEPKKDKLEYAAVFSANVHYQLSLAERLDFGKPQIKVSILNAKREVLATNESKSKLIQKLNFTAIKTGIYYLVFEFTKDLSGCGAAVLGFQRFQIAPNQHYELITKMGKNACYNDFFPKNEEKKNKKTASMYLWDIYIDSQFIVKITICYKKHEWTEYFQAKKEWTDQQLKGAIKALLKEKIPKKCFRIERLTPAMN